MMRKLAPVLDLVDSAVSLYRCSALCRAICLGTLMLIGILLIDALVGFPTGTRMAYVLPIWFATRNRGGRQAGATLVVLTTVALALIDSAKEGRTNSMLV